MRKFKIPNRLITDVSLSFSARRLGAYFCAVSNRLGLTRKSLAMLSGLSGLSVSTVQSAIDELERSGYLTRKRTYRFDPARAHMVYDRTVYQVHKYLPGGFTLVPSAVLQKRELSSSAFVLALYLCEQGAGQGRAFPSISRMVEAIGVAKSTVCRALQQLKNAAVRGLRIAELWLACDTDGALSRFKAAAERLVKAGFSREKIKCYALIGDDMDKNEARLREIYHAGAMPFAQLYRDFRDAKTEYSKEWNEFARMWQRPPAAKAHMEKGTDFRNYQT